jgi:MoxR-like ATPase
MTSDTRSSRPSSAKIATSADGIVNAWLSGSARPLDGGGVAFAPTDRMSPRSKLHGAYDWIVTRAILTSQGDLQPGRSRSIGRGSTKIEIGDGPSYSSFILLPLLNLMTSRRMVFVGAPGRGKTSVATLMSLLAGTPLSQARRQIQHGHPQMTVHDLLGSPLPSNLMKADTAAEVRLDWRQWLKARVKIVDEYNRIPTKTQSALLSLLAEGYAEMFEQTVEVGRSAWYLTANDELGGGTFPVIEALKDRIDAVVRCAPFQMEHIDALVARIASDDQPEFRVPGDIVFSAEELDAADAAVRKVAVPGALLEVVGFILGQLEFCRRASGRIDYMNKDTLHLAGRRVGHVCTEDCALDRTVSLCAQTENGVSPRALQSLIHYAQALAYFLGRDEVVLDDVRLLVPWVLFERLRPNLQSPLFEKDENKVHLLDRATWIQTLFDMGVQQFGAYTQIREDVSRALEQANDGTAKLPVRIAILERQMGKLLDDCELNGAVHADLVRLRRTHQALREFAPP